MNDLVFTTAQELARSIRQRQVSATEVLDAHLQQIARHNRALNAIVTLDEERARTRAREADAAMARGDLWGPLHGVPVTIKDSIETAGLRTTSGFPPLAEYVPATDAPVVARLRAAGAIILGKTNLPTLAMDVQTDNPIFGRSNNPWNLTRTPGGSTGGGGAAVAAGLTPLEIGSDIAGSVRIPAHYCGIYTIKPTDHRVPVTGHIPEPPGAPRGVRHMPQLGPLGRSVDDLILALGLIAGPDGRQWEVPPVPLEPAQHRALNELRFAWTDNFGGVSVSSDTKAALARFAGELQKLGSTVEFCPLAEFDFATAWETWGEVFQAEVGSTMPPEAEAQFAVQFGATLDADAPLVRGMAHAVNATMRQYTAALMKRDALIAVMEQFLATWDVLLCPVTAGPAFPHCQPRTPIAVDGGVVAYWTATAAYTTPFSLTGHPAVVLPMARSAEGLPIGLQVVGRRWGDMQLLAIARQLAEVIGPFQRPPGY